MAVERAPERVWTSLEKRKPSPTGIRNPVLLACSLVAKQGPNKSGNVSSYSLPANIVKMKRKTHRSYNYITLSSFIALFVQTVTYFVFTVKIQVTSEDTRRLLEGYVRHFYMLSNTCKMPKTLSESPFQQFSALGKNR